VSAWRQRAAHRRRRPAPHSTAEVRRTQDLFAPQPPHRAATALRRHGGTALGACRGRRGL